ncbi:MAG: transglutaminase-like domain-containing protein [Lentisphaerae bacterium]|nr:transglutaminase-like domain-containing protein [Lentisphaerota bacterium]
MRFARPGFWIVLFWLVTAAWLIRYEAFPGWFVGRALTLQAALDDTYRLMHFFTAMHSGNYNVRIDGQRIGPQRFRLTVRTPGDTRETEVDLPDDVLLHTPMNELILGQLAPGQSTLLRMFNPLTQGIDELRVNALRHEQITVDGQEYDTTLLQIFYHGMELRAWVDRTGQAVRQETPFGLVMELTTAAAAGRIETALPPAELLFDMAVPVTGVIRDPRGSAALDLQIGGAPETAGLESARQQIIARDAQQVTLRVRRQTAPNPDEQQDPPAELQPWLQPEPGLQSDHPEIIARARTIAAGREGWPLVRAIGAWVHENVAKEAAVSLPSAVDVLHELSGDCNEHTYLFVALARALGLPARVHVGLVYAELDNQRSAFYYHAWPAVWLNGQWLETDPTLGQELADATHITLAVGGLERQMELLGILGRMRITVLGEYAEMP